MEKDFVCKKHGPVKFRFERGRRRCIKCASACVQKRREKLKQMSIEYKGGNCQMCGYKKCSNAMEFHHLNPLEKDFALSHRGLTRSWDKIKIELDKCILLCANCHREIHANQ